MSDFTNPIDRKPQWQEAANWTAYTALGSVITYLAGYLTLRSHFTVIGVPADLNALDQQYLFAGARFFLYAALAVPAAMLLLLPVWGLWLAGGWIIRRFFRVGLNALVKRRRSMFAWRASSLDAAGIIWAVAVIQLVLRKCYAYHDLLAGGGGANDGFLSSNILLSEDETWRFLYFTAAVAAAGVTAWIKRASDHHLKVEGITRSPLLRYAMGFLLLVQCVLLPVNYGFFFDSRWAARVQLSASSEVGLSSAPMWLLNEGPNFLSVMVLETDSQSHKAKKPAIQSLRKDKIQKIAALCYDDIFAVSLGGKASCADSQ